MASGIGGATNTPIIVAQETANSGTGTFAALACVQYCIGIDGSSTCPSAGEESHGSVFGYSDWYLPASAELNQMWNENSLAGLSLASTLYWSSTEYQLTSSSHIAVAQQSVDGSGIQDKGNSYYVRCIRSF